MSESIDIEELATIISNLYGFVDGKRSLIKPVGQIGIFYALGAIESAVESKMLEKNPNFDVKAFREKTGFTKAKASIGIDTKDQ